MKTRIRFAGIILLLNMVYSQSYSSFENIILPEQGYLNGKEGATSYEDGGLAYPVQYNTNWDYWSGGFAISNRTDKTTPGYTNLFSACTGSGVLGSKQYAIGQDNAILRVLQPKTITGLYVTNTTYALKSMENGDSFAKKFGGNSGTDPDWFLLSIVGYLGGVPKNDTIRFYLADFRFDEPSRDYLVRTWRWVDLRSLQEVDSLKFILSSSDVGSFGMNTPAFFAIDNVNEPLFAPKAGVEGSTALNKEDVAIRSWATKATVSRGPQHIATLGSPLASVGNENSAIGKADNQVISLGDGGSIVLEFEKPIRNGAGFDFAVFENGFSFNNREFLELAHVEVSNDGVRYYRFPSISKTSLAGQVGGFETLDAVLIHNLAGKYVADFGTPFDLEDLKDSLGLDLESIRYVRIVDVVGSIHPLYATYDQNGNPINDPWPTDFASSGFDLDAVAVLNENNTNSITGIYSNLSHPYPNPFTDQINLSSPEKIRVFNIMGELVYESNNITDKIITEEWTSGLYFINMGNSTFKMQKNN